MDNSFIISEKNKILNRKNYIVVMDMKGKFSFQEVNLIDAWIANLTLILCRLDNGWVLTSNSLVANIKELKTQTQRRCFFNSVFRNRYNYYNPDFLNNLKKQNELPLYYLKNIFKL